MTGQDCFEADASIWKNTWSSCSKSMNPNSDHGNSHWIMYNLGEIRNMSKSWIWNCNDPDQLDRGFAVIEIDYSLDGSNWTNWGQFSCPKAEGHVIYSGFEGPDLQGIKCQFILLTVLSNHGNPNCSGIAEIKFNLFPGYEESLVSLDHMDFDSDEGIQLMPNPARDIIYINTELNSDQSIILFDNYGRIVLTDKINRNKNYVDISEIPRGVYYLKLEDKVSKFIKIK